MKIDEMNLAELTTLEQQLHDEIKALETELDAAEAEEEEILLTSAKQANIEEMLHYKIDLEAKLERYRR